MFTEPPVKIYEWIEPRRISEPDPNPVSTFKPSKPFASTSVHNSAPVTRGFASHNVFTERFSLDSKVSRRPLPPIPKEVEKPQPERNDSGLYKKFRNTNVDALRWQSRVFGARSKPLARCGSEPNLVGEDRQPRLSSSSQSLEFLDTLDAVEPQPEETRSKPTVKNAFLSLPRHCRAPPASAVATGNREPRPASDARDLTSPEDGQTAAAVVRPLPAAMILSTEDAMQSARGKSTTRTSTLRRQRPVSPGVRPRSATYRHSSLEELTASVDRPDEQDLDPAEDINPALPVGCRISSCRLTSIQSLDLRTSDDKTLCVRATNSRFYNSSAVAETGDRGHMHRKEGGGCCVPFAVGSWAPVQHNVAWVEFYFRIK